MLALFGGDALSVTVMVVAPAAVPLGTLKVTLLKKPSALVVDRDEVDPDQGLTRRPAGTPNRDRAEARRDRRRDEDTGDLLGERASAREQRCVARIDGIDEMTPESERGGCRERRDSAAVQCAGAEGGRAVAERHQLTGWWCRSDGGGEGDAVTQEAGVGGSLYRSRRVGQPLVDRLGDGPAAAGEVEVAAVVRRDRVTAGREGAGGEARMAGAIKGSGGQRRGSLLECHRAGGRAGAGRDGGDRRRERHRLADRGWIL